MIRILFLNMSRCKYLHLMKTQTFIGIQGNIPDHHFVYRGKTNAIQTIFEEMKNYSVSVSGNISSSQTSLSCSFPLNITTVSHWENIHWKACTSLRQTFPPFSEVKLITSSPDGRLSEKSERAREEIITTTIYTKDFCLSTWVKFTFLANHRCPINKRIYWHLKDISRVEKYLCLSISTPLPARIPSSSEFHIWLNWSYGVSFELISSILEERLFGFPRNVISFRLPCHGAGGVIPSVCSAKRYFSISLARPPPTLFSSEILYFDMDTFRHLLAAQQFKITMYR